MWSRSYLLLIIGNSLSQPPYSFKWLGRWGTCRHLGCTFTFVSAWQQHYNICLLWTLATYWSIIMLVTGRWTETVAVPWNYCGRAKVSVCLQLSVEYRIVCGSCGESRIWMFMYGVVFVVLVWTSPSQIIDRRFKQTVAFPSRYWLLSEYSNLHLEAPRPFVAAVWPPLIKVHLL